MFPCNKINNSGMEKEKLHSKTYHQRSINPVLSIIIIIIIIIIIELTHGKHIPENTVEFEAQPVALGFENLSQYSSR